MEWCHNNLASLLGSHENNCAGNFRELWSSWSLPLILSVYTYLGYTGNQEQGSRCITHSYAEVIHGRPANKPQGSWAYFLKSGTYFTKGLWAHNSNLIKKICCSYVKNNDWFMFQFYTCHDSFSCHDMCKIGTWLEHYNKNQSQYNFHKISIMSS